MTGSTQGQGNLHRYRIAVLLVALAFGTLACGGPGTAPETVASTDSTVIAEDSTTTGVENAAQHPKGDSTVVLDWTDSDYAGDHLLATGDGFLAYSLDPDPMGWESSDGVAWTEREVTPGDFDQDPIRSAGLGYYAVGSSEFGHTLWTSDDGFAWERHELDLETPAFDDFGPPDLETIAAGSAGLVLVGRQDHQSHDEHRFVVWTSQDAITWSLVEDPFAGSFISEVLALDGGFLAHGGGEVLWSADGRLWEPVLREEPTLPGNAAGSWGGRAVTATVTEVGVELLDSDDGRTWQQLPSHPVLEHSEEFNVFPEQIFTGPMGIALVGRLESSPMPHPPTVIERDDVIVTVEPDVGRLTVTDRSTGEVLVEAEIFDEEVVIIDDDVFTITVIDPDTGEELVTFTGDEFEEATEKAFENAGIDMEEFGNGGEGKSVLWFSPDGERWTIVEIEEVFGTQELPYDVVVGAEALVVRWSGWSFQDEEEGEESGAEEFTEDVPDVVWVGTLAVGQ